MEVIKYRKRKVWKYGLVGEFCVQTNLRPAVLIHTDYGWLNKTGLLTIYSGYCWDGASFIIIDTKTVMRASLVHDCLYQLMRSGILPRSFRQVADLEFKRICLEDNMMSFRAHYLHRGLVIGGASSTLDDVITAP